MAQNTTYDASSITVLEGLEGSAETTGHVYRQRFHEGLEPPDL